MESSLPRSPASAVVITSIPRRRKPSAMAGSKCSARWNRMVLGMEFRESLLQFGRSNLGLHIRDEGFLVGHLPQDLVLVVPKISQCRVDIGERQLGKRRNDFVGRLTLEFMPDVDVLD